MQSTEIKNISSSGQSLELRVCCAMQHDERMVMLVRLPVPPGDSTTCGPVGLKRSLRVLSGGCCANVDPILGPVTVM
jgi:hypothetical protein